MTFKQQELINTKKIDKEVRLDFWKFTKVSQTYSSGGYTNLTWTGPSNLPDSDFNGTVWTCRKAGRYKIRAGIAVNGNYPKSTNHFQINAIVNGVAYNRDRDNFHSASNPTTSLYFVIDLDIGDTVYIRTYQDSGSTRSIYGGGNLNYWTIAELPSIKSTDKNAIKYITKTINVDSSYDDNIIGSTPFIFTRVNDVVTINFTSTLTINHNGELILYDIIPKGFRPQTQASIVYSFTYATATDWGLTAYSDGRMKFSYRKITTSSPVASSGFRAQAITFITEDSFP